MRIVLLGGSNCVIAGGLKDGLLSGILEVRARDVCSQAAAKIIARDLLFDGSFLQLQNQLLGVGFEEFAQNANLYQTMWCGAENDTLNDASNDALNNLASALPKLVSEPYPSVQKSYNSDKYAFTNLALGATSCVQNLYEAVRHSELVKRADLVVFESNINDFYFLSDGDVPMDSLIFSLYLAFCELYHTARRVVVALLPLNALDFAPHQVRLHAAHRALAAYFGFSVVDLHASYSADDLAFFGDNANWRPHELAGILRELGRNIALGWQRFLEVKRTKNIPKPVFKIVPASELQGINAAEKLRHDNSYFKEDIWRLPQGAVCRFSAEFSGWRLIGVHAWNLIYAEDMHFSGLRIGGVRKFFITLDSVQEIVAHTLIEPNLELACDNSEPPNEGGYRVDHVFELPLLPYIDLCGFLLLFNWQEFSTPELKASDFARDEFLDLLPDIGHYRAVIAEFLAHKRS